MAPGVVAAAPGETVIEETVDEETVDFDPRLLSDVLGPTAAQPAKIEAVIRMAAERAADWLTRTRGAVVINGLGYKALIFKRFRGTGGHAPQAKFTERVGFQQLVRRPV